MCCLALFRAHTKPVRLLRADIITASHGKAMNDVTTKLIASNRKAFHDYNIIERLECGIALVEQK